MIPFYEQVCRHGVKFRAHCFQCAHGGTGYCACPRCVGDDTRAVLEGVRVESVPASFQTSGIGWRTPASCHSSVLLSLVLPSRKTPRMKRPQAGAEKRRNG